MAPQKEKRKAVGKRPEWEYSTPAELTSEIMTLRERVANSEADIRELVKRMESVEEQVNEFPIREM